MSKDLRFGGTPIRTVAVFAMLAASGFAVTLALVHGSSILADTRGGLAALSATELSINKGAN